MEERTSPGRKTTELERSEQYSRKGEKRGNKPNLGRADIIQNPFWYNVDISLKDEREYSEDNQASRRGNVLSSQNIEERHTVHRNKRSFSCTMRRESVPCRSITATPWSQRISSTYEAK